MGTRGCRHGQAVGGCSNGQGAGGCGGRHAAGGSTSGCGQVRQQARHEGRLGQGRRGCLANGWCSDGGNDDDACLQGCSDREEDRDYVSKDEYELDSEVEEDELVGNDHKAEHVPHAEYDKDDPPMTVGLGPIVQGKSKCPWRIHASVKEDLGTVMVKKNPYDHNFSSTRRKKKVKNATKHWIAAKVKDFLIGDPTVPAKVLQKKLKEHHKTRRERSSNHLRQALCLLRVMKYQHHLYHSHLVKVWNLQLQQREKVPTQNLQGPNGQEVAQISLSSFVCVVSKIIVPMNAKAKKKRKQQAKK